MRRTLTFGSAVRWNLGGSIARVMLTIVVQISLLRILGPTIAGQFAIFLLIAGVGSVVSDGGTGTALTRVKDLDVETLRAGLFWTLLYSIPISGLLILGSPILVRAFQLPEQDRYIIILAAMNVVPMVVTSVPLSVLKRHFRSRNMQTLQVLAYFVGFLAIGLPLALMYRSVGVLIIAFSTQTLVTGVGAWIITKCPLLPSWGGASSKLKGFGAKAIATNVASFVIESIDNAYIARFLGTRQLGLYSMSFNLGRMPTDTIITTLYSPLLVSTAQDDHAGVGNGKRYLEILHAASCLAIPIYLFVWISAGRIVVPLLGRQWVDASPLLSVLALAMLLRLFGTLSASVVWGKGVLLLEVLAQSLGVAAFVAIAYATMPATAHQVALVIVAAYLVRTSIQLASAIFMSHIRIEGALRALVLPSLMSGLAMVPIFLIDRALPQDASLGGLMILGSAFALCYLLRVAVALRKGDFQWTHMIRNRVTAIVPRFA